MVFDSTEEAQRAFSEWQARLQRVRGAEEDDLAREAFTAGFLENARQLEEAEDALLEAQKERDELQGRLDEYEPPYRPKKFT